MVHDSVARRSIDAALDEAVRQGEHGVQVAAYLNGELIVDSWCGPSDNTGHMVDGETLFSVFSVTKAVTATSLHIQADRGLIDYDASVANYWPEYGVNGKQRTTVRDILTHRSGAPQMPETVTPEKMGDWEWMVSELAQATPLFEPGTTSAYHTISWGWLVGELVRRTDPAKRPFERFVQEEICAPLAIQDLHLGLDEREHDRVATLLSEMVAPPVSNPLAVAAMPQSVAVGPDVYNRTDVRAAVVPGAGGIMNARSAARFFAMLAGGGELDGVRILSRERVLACSVPRANPFEIDQVGGVVRWIGAGGYWLGGESPPADPVVGNGAHTLCHPGAGGSIAWADIDTGLAGAICHNRMFSAEAVQLAEHPFIPVGDAVRAVAAVTSGSNQAHVGDDRPR